MRLITFNNVLLAGSVAGTALAQSETPECATGLQVFISRGTNETLGPGVTGALGEILEERIPGTHIQPVLYPASFMDPDYYTSVGNGTSLLRQLVEEYAEACPDSKIALLGYSQGAQITTNNLCGTPAIWALSGNTSLTPLPKDTVEKHIAAVVLFGDPTFKVDDNFSRGTAKGSGMFFRGNHTACNAVGDRIASYCDAADPFCDVVSEITRPDVHTTYLERYLEEAAEWIVERFEKGSSTSPGPGGNNATTSAITSAPSTLPTDEPSGAGSLTPKLLVFLATLVAAAGLA